MARDFISDIIAQDFPLAYAFDFDKETSPKQAVFVAKDGLYERTHQAHFDMLYKTTSLTARKGFGSITPYVDPVAEMPRVPIKVVATIFAFFREIYSKAKTEVQINVYWNRDHKEIPNVPGMKDWGNDLYTYVPKQRVSSARTTFEDDETYLWMIKNTVIVLDTHSHHDMSAFMSGTDQSSSNIPAVYFDMGKITSKNAQIFAWCAVDDKHIFENLPLSELYKFMEPLPDPVNEPIKTWDKTAQEWKSSQKPLVGTGVKGATGVATKPISTYKSNDHLFDSEALLALAEDVPKEWGEQVIVPKITTPAYSSFGRGNFMSPYAGGYAQSLGLADDLWGSGVPHQGTLWDNFGMISEDLVEETALAEAEDDLSQELECTHLVSAIIAYPEWALDGEYVNRFYDVINLTDQESLKSQLLREFGGHIQMRDCQIIEIQSALSDAYGLFREEVESETVKTLADLTDAYWGLIAKINAYTLADTDSVLSSGIWYDVVEVFGEGSAFRLETALVQGDLEVYFKTAGRPVKEGHSSIKHDIFDALDIKVTMSQPLIDILGLKTAK